MKTSEEYAEDALAEYGAAVRQRDAEKP